MAIQITATPDTYESAYKPLRYTFKSTLYPVAQQTSDVGNLFEVRRPTAAELAGNDFLSKNDVLFSMNGVANVVRGTWLRVVSGTTNYQGAWRVSKVVSQGLYVVDVPYEGAELGLFADVRRHYRGHYIRAVLNNKNDTNNGIPVETVRLFANPDGNFVYDPAEAMRSQLGPLLLSRSEVASWNGAGWVRSGVGTMASRYDVELTEWYEVPDPVSGLPSVVEDKSTSNKTGLRWALNIAVPYMHRDQDGTGTHHYVDAVASRLIDQNTSGSDLVKWATNAPSDGKVKAYIDDYLALHVYASEDAPQVKLRLRRFDSSGNSLGVTITTGQQLPVGTQIPIGPAHLGTTYIPTNTAYYIVDLRDAANTESISPEFRIDVTAACGEVRRTFDWLSPWGGIDTYTLIDREVAASSVEEDLYEKPLSIADATGFPDFSYRAHGRDITEAYETSDLLHKEVVWWLRELLRSPVRYTYFRPNEYPVPVILQGGAELGSLDTRKHNLPFAIAWRVAVREQTEAQRG